MSALVSDRLSARAGARVLATLLASGWVSLGCNATCIRDSDCLGKSICTENRCILIVSRDGGTQTPPASGEPSDGDGGAGGSGALPSTPDAGE